jgi:hypothetical protein
MFEGRQGAGVWDPPPPTPWAGDRSGRLRLLLPDCKVALSVVSGKGHHKILEIELTEGDPHHQ